MIIVEVYTHSGPYQVTTQARTLKEGITEVMTSLENNRNDLELLDGSLLYIPRTDVVISYRAYEMQDTGYSIDLAEINQELKDGGVSLFNATTEYLGNKVKFKGYQLTRQESAPYTFYIVQEINGEPAYDRLAAEKLKKVFDDWATLNAPGPWLLITPPAQLSNMEEALEYLKDYVAETSPEYKAKVKTAKAWGGWAGDAERGGGNGL